MRDPVNGVPLIAPQKGLSPHTFIASDATHWVIRRLEDVQSEAMAIDFLSVCISVLFISLTIKFMWNIVFTDIIFISNKNVSFIWKSVFVENARLPKNLKLFYFYKNCQKIYCLDKIPNSTGQDVSFIHVITVDNSLILFNCINIAHFMALNLFISTPCFVQELLVKNLIRHASSQRNIYYVHGFYLYYFLTGNAGS